MGTAVGADVSGFVTVVGSDAGAFVTFVVPTREPMSALTGARS